jgi:lipopolysaccharide export system permease protein
MLRFFGLTIIDRYIIGKFLSTFVFIVLAVVVVVITIDFAENLNRYIDKKVSALTVLRDYYPYILLFLLNLFSPICIFLSVILFTARLAQQTEFVALLSGGVSFYRLFRPYLITALLLMTLSFLLQSYIVPTAVKRQKDFEYKYIRKDYFFDARNIHRKVERNTFATIYSYDYIAKIMDHFLLEHIENGRIALRIKARRGKWNPERQSWTLSEVVIRRFDGLKETLENRPTLDTILKLKPDDIFQIEHYTKSLTIDELKAYIALERDRGSDFVEALEIEQQERLAYPFAALVLTTIGFALASRKRRGGIAFQLGIGFVISFIYIFVLLTGRMALSDWMPEKIAVWVPNALFGVVGLVLLRLAPK